MAGEEEGEEGLADTFRWVGRRLVSPTFSFFPLSLSPPTFPSFSLPGSLCVCLSGPARAVPKGEEEGRT